MGQSKKDDPYYCGLRARIPNFAKTKAQKEKEAALRYSQQQQQQVAGGGQMPLGAHPMMAAWHRGYMENAPPHHAAMGGYAGYAGTPVRNGGRPFERNPTTWVPQAPMRNEYESDYSHIYGRLPLGAPHRVSTGFRPFPPGVPNGGPGQRQVYVSEWE